MKLAALAATGGRHVEARAAPLKTNVGAMVDLLTDPKRAQHQGPIRLS